MGSSHCYLNNVLRYTSRGDKDKIFFIRTLMNYNLHKIQIYTFSVCVILYIIT